MDTTVGMRLSMLIVFTLLAASCSSAARTSEGGSRGGVQVQGSQLASSPTVLDGLANLVPSFEVNRPASSCPRISLRGGRTITRPGDPVIYVNGIRMLDTCSLDNISVSQVRLVEVFHTSGSPPAGYQIGPFGTILVHLVTS